MSAVSNQGSSPKLPSKFSSELKRRCDDFDRRYIQGRLKALGVELIKILGSGQMAQVYLASQNGEKLAVKISLPECGHSLTREAKIFKEVLDVPHIVQTGVAIPLLTNGEVGAICMEYIPCLDMCDMYSQKQITVEELALAADKFLTTLKGLNRINCVHCDIKPENLYYDRETGVARIADFGVSSTAKNRAEHVGGTFEYGAPEMVLSGDLANHKMDIWGLGVTLYNLLTQSLLVEKSSHNEIITADSSCYSKVKSGLWEALLRTRMRNMKVSSKLQKALVAMLREMIAFDPKARKTAHEICQGTFKTLEKLVIQGTAHVSRK